MNKEPKPELPKFILNIGEEKIVCTPENTLAFLYEENKYDHIFYVTQKDEEDNLHGYHIFRHLVPEGFDILIKRMIDGGYAVSNEEDITENDLAAFKKSLPDYYELPDPEEGWGNTKMAQAKKWGQFVAYLAEEIANGKQ